jgi:hypothetical protein
MLLSERASHSKGGLHIRDIQNLFDYVVQGCADSPEILFAFE